MATAVDEARINHLQVAERLENTTNLLNQITPTLHNQNFLVRTTLSLANQMYQMLSGELKASLSSIEKAVASFWYVNPRTRCIDY